MFQAKPTGWDVLVTRLANQSTDWVDPMDRADPMDQVAMDRVDPMGRADLMDQGDRTVLVAPTWLGED